MNHLTYVKQTNINWGKISSLTYNFNYSLNQDYNSKNLGTISWWILPTRIYEMFWNPTIRKVGWKVWEESKIYKTFWIVETARKMLFAVRNMFQISSITILIPRYRFIKVSKLFPFDSNSRISIKIWFAYQLIEFIFYLAWTFRKTYILIRNFLIFNSLGVAFSYMFSLLFIPVMQLRFLIQTKLYTKMTHNMQKLRHLAEFVIYSNCGNSRPVTIVTVI